MPFKSAKQERFMFANHKDIAKRWVKEYGNAKGYGKAKAYKKVMQKRGK